MIRYKRQHVLIAPVNRESPFNNASQGRNHLGKQQPGGLKSLFVKYNLDWQEVLSQLLTRNPKSERLGSPPKVTQYKGQPGAQWPLQQQGRERRGMNSYFESEGGTWCDQWNVGGVWDEEAKD